ncbi:FtsH protease activity modulator HflK [Candidatus Omnitrophota bacterium]
MDFDTPEELLNIGKEKANDLKKLAPLVIAVVLIIMGLTSVIYSIGPDEVGVLQRFGKYVATATSGLHVKLPFGIDKVTPIKVTKIFKEEFGLRTIRAGVRTQYSKRAYHEESLMLTGDLNILDVRWIVQYKVKDPLYLLFKTRDPVDNIRDISEVVMRRLVGDYLVDEVLTTKRTEIDDFAKLQIQEILDKYQTGVQIVTVKLLDVNPSDEVKPAFNEVNEAKQEKERTINQAWEAYNKVVPKAKGEAERTIREAEGYYLAKVNNAKGEAERFLAILQEYKKAPQVTKKRLYLETLAEVLPLTKEKYIIDPKQSGILPLLKLGEQGGQE